MLRSSKTAKAGWRSAWQGRSIHFAKSHVGMALQVRACMRACVRGCVRAAGAARPSVLRRVTCGPTSSPISPFPAMSLFPPCIYAFVLAAPSLRSPPPYPHPYHPSIHPLLFGPPLSHPLLSFLPSSLTFLSFTPPLLLPPRVRRIKTSCWMQTASAACASPPPPTSAVCGRGTAGATRDATWARP